MVDFNTLFENELKDMYSSEQQIVKALPKMINAASSKKLKAALDTHLNETQEQVQRLDEIAKELNLDFSDADCPAMRGILEEGEEALDEYNGEVLDAAIIGAAQRVEHYEIAVYGTLITYAKILDLPNVEKLLKKSIAEEKEADSTLSKIAEGTFFSHGVNKRAAG
ncbi:MAG TPA: ferritin-like domain-containing protein [Rhabdochlamydiaceae bacterium]|nr:ferritin-like domain-containing protein [Rhabdochlamydiaceae bacterium]HSX38876.1 ferritin-like domain-containing protein [Chlamydiales bacterium]